MDAHQSLAEAIAHLKAGRKSQAQSILGRLVQQEPSLADGWLWLAACFDDREKQVYCLKKVLSLDPGHEKAQRALAKLHGTPAPTPTHANAPRATSAAAPASESAYTWPQSGVQASLPGVPSINDPPAVPVATRAASKAAAQKGQHFAWFQVWLSVLIKPHEGILRMVLDDPEARPGRGYLWVFTTGTIGFLFSVVVFSLRFDQLLRQMAATSQLGGNAQAAVGYILIGMLVLSPLAGGMSILAIIIGAAIYQLVAQVMGGKGTFKEMVYVMCAIAAPMYLVSALFSALPQAIAGILGFIVSLYSLYLTLAAIKAVNRFTWGSSCVTVIAAPVIILLCSCLIGFMFSMAAVPGIEELMQTLTPMP
ncbi:MAG: YIP1 family protein [Chloroflexota bacterium]